MVVFLYVMLAAIDHLCLESIILLGVTKWYSYSTISSVFMSWNTSVKRTILSSMSWLLRSIAFVKKKRWDKSLILFSLFFSIFQSLSCAFLLSYYYKLVDLNIFNMFQSIAVIILYPRIINLWPVGSSLYPLWFGSFWFPFGTTSVIF